MSEYIIVPYDELAGVGVIAATLGFLVGWAACYFDERFQKRKAQRGKREVAEQPQAAVGDLVTASPEWPHHEVTDKGEEIQVVSLGDIYSRFLDKLDNWLVSQPEYPLMFLNDRNARRKISREIAKRLTTIPQRKNAV